MGEKGEKRTAVAGEAAERFAAALEPLGDITTKGMFGGYGVFHDGAMFGLVDSSGSWFLKTDDAGGERIAAVGGEKHGRMPYWSVPDEVASDEATLLAWAQESIRLSHV